MPIKKMIKYREVWMGLAMLWIMLYHVEIDTDLRLFNFIKQIGYGGVDIFLFASGIGNYYSFSKNEEALPFIKRRISRLAPIYLPFIIVWCVYQIAVGRLRPIYVIGNLFAIQEFSYAGLSFNWYLGALIICYLLTPYLATYIKQNSFFKSAALAAVLTLLTTAFWNDERFIITATRLPIYTIGMIFAKYDSEVINKRMLTVGALMFVVGNLILFEGIRFFPAHMWSKGFYWYPFILIVPFLCCMMSWFSSLVEKTPFFAWGNSVLRTIGKNSFEIYLIHCFIVLECSKLLQSISDAAPFYIATWILNVVFSFFGAFVLHIISIKVKQIPHLWQSRQAH